MTARGALAPPPGPANGPDLTSLAIVGDDAIIKSGSEEPVQELLWRPRIKMALAWDKKEPINIHSTVHGHWHLWSE